MSKHPLSKKIETPLALSHAKLTATGLTFDKATTFDQWRAAFGQLRTMHGATLWWIGDAINFGERSYGEKYAQALKETDYSLSTLHHAAWVCGAVASCIRDTSLPFEHHAIVAKLTPEDQAKWLKLAAEHRMSRLELKASIGAGRLMRDNEIAELSGRDSGLGVMLQGVMGDFGRWMKSEIGDDTDVVEKWPIERVKALWEELRPAYQLGNKCASIIAKQGGEA